MNNNVKKTAFFRARNAVFRFLKNRLHSEKEIRDKLAKKKFDTQIITQTIQYFKDINLIDDRQFTQQWIASRLAKPFGINRIRFELNAKGIPKTILKEEIQNMFVQYPEVEIVTELLKKQKEKYHDADQMKIKQRLYGYLARRGFNNDAITKAMGQI